MQAIITYAIIAAAVAYFVLKIVGIKTGRTSCSCSGGKESCNCGCDCSQCKYNCSCGCGKK